MLTKANINQHIMSKYTASSHATVPAEISVTVDSVLLRGDCRPYLGKDRAHYIEYQKSNALSSPG